MLYISRTYDSYPYFTQQNIIRTEPFCPGHVLHLHIHVFLGSSVVVSQVTNALEPGTKPGLCAGDEEGIIANKTQATVWPTGPQRQCIK